MTETVLDLPNGWQPRSYQQKLWRYMHAGGGSAPGGATAASGATAAGGKRAVWVAHRRAGKDSVALNYTACAAHERIGTYWHMAPQTSQARKVVWDGIDRDGQRMIDRTFPLEIREATNQAEMKITLRSGSIWQCVGSDNYNSLIGSNPIGVVFSEYAVADPAAWDYIRPILAENGGWALFIYTPRGRNHGATLYEMAKANDAWFAELLTVRDTGAIPLEVVEEERAAGMSDEMIQQEFFCSFAAALVGSYYGKLLAVAEEDGRIANVPYEPRVPVETWWDLGVGDSTAIWFAQRVGREVRLIDYYENAGEGLPHYARILQHRDYVYSRHIAPHDIEVRELGSGKARIDVAKELGIKFSIAPRLSIEDGIDAVRGLLPMCWFDAKKCARGLEALKGYRKLWDEVHKTYRDNPLHSWESHGSDAFRMGAIAREPKGRPQMRNLAPILDLGADQGVNWMGG